MCTLFLIAVLHTRSSVQKLRKRERDDKLWPLRQLSEWAKDIDMETPGYQVSHAF
jgi:hypothetical protein